MQKWISFLSKKFDLKHWQIENTWNLLNDGATIPFIARYRKELTGNLNEVVLQQLSDAFDEAKNIEKRKEFILNAIEQQYQLTIELKNEIINCFDKDKLEDLYLPFKPKRRNKAQIARENGLEPLAKIIYQQHTQTLPDITPFKNSIYDTNEKVLEGTKHIIIEWISENSLLRDTVRNFFTTQATIVSKIIKTKQAEAENYKMYFDFKEPLTRCPSHRLLAMLRGKNEGFLRVTLEIDNEKALKTLRSLIIKDKGTCSKLVGEALTEAYQKHIKPSIEKEITAKAKQRADEEAIQVFAQNLKQLLLAPPMGERRVLAIDPGFKTGCKVVCLDEHGQLLHNENIYPHPPQNEKKLSEKKLQYLVNAYKIELIAIGDGTASRETESFVKAIPFERPVKVYVVNEAGASIYSASAIARKEFPQYDVTVRSAVSIGRRLQDPLAELVKIDPKSIGVGQYQHDVDQTLLKKALDRTVEECVHKVGVKLNNASEYLLKYVSGIGEKLATTIVAYRNKYGRFNNLYELYNVPHFGDKAFQLSAGFLRIENGTNPLDNTSIHPEKYPLVEKMAKDLGININELMNNKANIEKIKIENYISEETGRETLTDIIDNLLHPGYDMRCAIKILEFDKNIHKFEDLKVGMILPGIVTNITNFGAFINIGIKENGLVHISNICNEYITSPHEKLHIHQHVKVKVISLDKKTRRIQLSIKDVE